MNDLIKTGCILVTGGAGFIGSAFIRQLLELTDYRVINIDALTYAGNLATVSDVGKSPRYEFVHADIIDGPRMRQLFEINQPLALVHLAAESHVDRSIDGPGVFITSNIVGTYTLLEEARRYVAESDSEAAAKFRFHHVSTDEVFGSLGCAGEFTEESPYLPNSPYSASKAASDHLVRAWGETFRLNTLVSNCSNNYGPYQYPEKLIPVIVQTALRGEAIPVYGKGDNVRDWLFVEDHARALVEILQNGVVGRTYNVGGNAERSNLDVVQEVCAVLDEIRPRQQGGRYADLIEFVTDRPGHDYRYAIDNSRIISELNWKPLESFSSGIRKTVRWYVDQQSGWTETVLAGKGDEARRGLGAT